jgi:hypothetical protein
MIYFIADFGFFECPDNFPKLKNMSKNIQQNFDITKDILLLGGDNFYPNGLTYNNVSTCVKNFNKCFQPIKHNIFGLLGNHDYNGNVNYQLTGYNRDTTIKKYNMFNMPDKYYKIEYADCDIYMLDTCIISPEYANDIYDILKHYKSSNYNRFTLCDYNIMLNAIKYMQEKRNEQLKWLDKHLTETVNNNKIPIVCGHFPIFTTGAYEYTNINNLMFKYLVPLFIKHNVKIYISGHDHCTLLQSFNMSTIKEIYNSQTYNKLDNDTIITELFPEFYSYLYNDDCDYILYNIVSGACMDNYLKFANTVHTKNSNNIKINLDDITIYKNYIYSLYTGINILPDNTICINFIHNQNYEIHKSNLDKQYIEYSYYIK